MRVSMSMLVLVVLLVASGCSGDHKVWFRGDFEAALAAAKQRNTMIMIDFYTTWCTYCRRMKKESYALPEVQQELQQLVALRLNAEGRGADLAARFSVGSYPTIVFLDPDGSEVDRLHYLPPQQLVEAVRRIRTGDTFVACLARNQENPSDLGILQRTVSGLLDRLDPEAALSRIDAYHKAGGEDLCPLLRFKAGAAIHTRLYKHAGELFRDGWPQPLDELAGVGITPALDAVLGSGRIPPDLADADRDEQARLLRDARSSDAKATLAFLPSDGLGTDELLAGATFAFDNGHYDTALDLYLRWYQQAGDEAVPEELEAAAGNLSLSGRGLETALEMATAAHAEEASASRCATLARLLYQTGEVQQALQMQEEAITRARQALTEAGMVTDSTSDEYQDQLDRMRAGQPLEDQPPFERYPQE